MVFSLPTSLPSLETPLGRFMLIPMGKEHHPELGDILLDERLWVNGYGDGEWRPESFSEMPKYIESAFNPYQVFAVMKNPEYFGHSGLAGTTGITQIVPGDARVRIGRTLLSPDLWGAGVNHEIKVTLLTWIFSHGIERVECLVDGRNVPSSNSLMKFGFSHEGLMRKYSQRMDGTWKDISLYSILSEEWPGIQERNINRLNS
jgi:RimJ/RimL family protein N-acetyltransferase